MQALILNEATELANLAERKIGQNTETVVTTPTVYLLDREGRTIAIPQGQDPSGVWRRLDGGVAQDLGRLPCQSDHVNVARRNAGKWFVYHTRFEDHARIDELMHRSLMLVTALTIAREREQGTFDQLLVTPLRQGEILVGKTIPGFVIGVIQATAILLVATLWFQVPLLGSLLAFYAGLALFLLSGVGAGLLISSLAATQQQGLLGAFLFMVPAVILSGFATPIANMPKVVQALTLVDPLRYFLVILRKVFLEGAGFAVLAGQLWPMALIGVVSLVLAGWLFRHRLY